MHVWEVLHHELLAVIPVAWEKEEFSNRYISRKSWYLTEAVVLLEIDGVLGDHDGVLDVSLHPFQALDALVASVPVER